MRGEIWTANLGGKRRWVVIVSLNPRNVSDRVNSVLAVPFGSGGVAGPTTLELEPGETGLPSTSHLKGHFITTLTKSLLIERYGRLLSARRMNELVLAIRRAFDPDAPAPPEHG